MAPRKYDPICQLEGCGEPHASKGWCRRHYEQVQRGKTPRLETSQYTDSLGTCAAPNCDNSFQQRSVGSVRKYCSKKCRDRTVKAAERAQPDYIPRHRRPGRKPCSVNGCELPAAHHVRVASTWMAGYCPMHHERILKYRVGPNREPPIGRRLGMGTCGGHSTARFNSSTAW